MTTPNDMAGEMLREGDLFTAKQFGQDILEVDPMTRSTTGRKQMFEIVYGAIRPVSNCNPDAHLGAEEKPYKPLVNFRYHGSNVHTPGKANKGSKA